MIQTALTHEPFESYKSASKDYLGSHQLADFRRCPLLFWRKHQGLQADADTDAFALGRAAHTLILEGREAFDRQYAVGGPINPKTGRPFGPATQAYAEWEAKQGKRGVCDDDYDLIHQMWCGVRNHAFAAQLLAEGEAECVGRGTYHHTACQIRLDWFNQRHGIADLKTCDDLTWFEADAKRFGYLHQMAFYRAVLAALTGQVYPVHIIAIEKKEPFRCGVWRLDDQALDYARRENESAIERLNHCRATNVWPTGYEEKRVFDSI